MKYKDKVISLVDTTQNRVENLSKMIENNSPLSREQLITELNSISKSLEYISDTVGLEDNDFAALEGRMR